MKKLFLFLLLCYSTLAQKTDKQLIIRGDDMGFSHSGNLALIKTFNEGIEKSIEIIVPSPWFPEAVQLLRENPSVDVGIHIALTSEWDNIKYRPLTNCPSLTDADGYFYPFIYPNKNYPGQSLSENNWKIEEIEKEIRAQIELGLKKTPRISHISSHMGCYNMKPEISAIAKKLAQEYGIDIDPRDYGVKSIGYGGPSKTLAEKIESFTKMLKGIKPGEKYLFVDHPALNNEEVKAIHHIGYENVATDRQGVVDLWTNPKIRALIDQLGIELISYADLKKQPKSLFNGKDFTGWHIDVPAMENNSGVASPFIIREGKMVSLAKPGGHIITDAKYENFQLTVEYRFAAAPGNCGILVHASKPRRLYGMFPQSIEVQLMHENAGDFWCIGENIEVPDMEARRGPKEKWGVDGDKNRRIINLTDGTEKPLGQWNTMVVECLGTEVKVWLNNVLVNHGHNATVSKGQIALQAEGSEVEFNKVIIKSIDKLSQ
ncbi:MAG: ChbG/HpnK family deacetylase [Bacteroidota bacterium]